MSVSLRETGAFGIGEQDLGGLLGDGGPAGHPMPGADVLQQRAQQAARIDAVMRIEAAVFHGDEGGRQSGRHLLQGQPLADQRAAAAGDLALGVQEGEATGRLTA